MSGIDILGGGEELNLDISDAPKEEIETSEGKIEIIWRAKAADELENQPEIRSYRETVVEKIIEVVNEINILEVMPAIGFVIERNRRRGNAYVNPEEGRELVHINAGYIHRRFEGERTEHEKERDEIMNRGLESTIHHEIIHLFDDFYTNSSQEMARQGRRLSQINEEATESLEKIENELRRDRAVKIADLRKMVSMFIHRIRAEGLARIYDGSLESKFEGGLYHGESREERFRGLYSKAENRASTIRRILNEKIAILKNAETEEELEDAIKAIENNLEGDNMYVIGEHVVYSVLYEMDEDPMEPALPIEEIAQLNPRELIKYYNEVAQEEGMEPLVSWDSGKGMLDYGELVNKVSKAFDSVTKVES